ncbi:aldehyde dehydrogenase family protein [Meridianimarinicoccus aquatilis]|nr:aldehyde dehydrogenase family protein [Fluviibacterium aquatile]
MPYDTAVPHRLLIGGAWEVAQGHSLPRCDPATEAARLPVIAASDAQVLHAVRAAEASGWQTSGRTHRLSALAQMIEGIEARAESFAQTISREIGVPIDFARRSQVEAALNHLRAMQVAYDATPDDMPVAPDCPADRVRYEPVGVAALITPWNWPLNQIVLKVGAALLAGCPMVLKPSELGADTAMLFAICMEDIDLPPGTFNLVMGGADTGAALVAHPAIAAVSFTGSTRAGQSIAIAAAQGFRRTILEMGGKSPNVLFEDCDVDTAMRQGLAHCFRNNGQSCNAASRMLVARGIYEKALEKAAQIVAEIHIGLPDQPGDHIGPQVSAAQHAHVQHLLQSGIDAGARLVVGGPGRPEGYTRGYFTRPSVLADVTPEMRVFREEIFGPVLTVTPFDSEAEAIALANDTPYGLAGYVQTADAACADRMARALRVGMVQVNGQSRAPGAPFGGVKASGVGREAGLWGIRAFQDVKSISGAVSDASI